MSTEFTAYETWYKTHKGKFLNIYKDSPNAFMRACFYAGFKAALSPAAVPEPLVLPACANCGSSSVIHLRNCPWWDADDVRIAREMAATPAEPTNGAQATSEPICARCEHPHLTEHAQQIRDIGGLKTICGMPCWDEGKGARRPCRCSQFTQQPVPDSKATSGTALEIAQKLVAQIFHDSAVPHTGSFATDAEAWPNSGITGDELVQRIAQAIEASNDTHGKRAWDAAIAIVNGKDSNLQLDPDARGRLCKAIEERERAARDKLMESVCTALREDDEHFDDDLTVAMQLFRQAAREAQKEADAKLMEAQEEQIKVILQAAVDEYYDRYGILA